MGRDLRNKVLRLVWKLVHRV